MGKAKDLLEGLISVVEGAEKVSSAIDGLRSGRLGRTPPGRQLPSEMAVEERNVRTIGERVKYIVKMIQKGRDDPNVRKFAVQAVSKRCGDKWCTKEGDYDEEVRAVFLALKSKYRYVRDTYKKDLFQHPARTLEFGGGDCFPEGTLVLRDDHALVPIDSLEIGDRIWGLDRWSEVSQKVYKGNLPVDVAVLNNGSQLMLTRDHDLTIAHCGRHRMDRKGGPCSCPVSEREKVKIAFSELREGMVLICPDRVPYGKEEMDPDRAYVEGLYVADGWCGKRSAFDISGRDGHPKEKQKQEVEAICNRLGISTHIGFKSIAVKDPEWVVRMQAMGKRAPEKHILSLNLSEAPAAAILRGILADSGVDGISRTFTTTSRQLAVQVRVLCKMMGVNCGWWYVENHGGLGKNPIYRLYIRDRTLAQRKEKLLRVKRIEKNVAKVPCWDITTDDHYVYLPEHDVTVNQCDCATILVCSALGSIGYPSKCRVIRTKTSEDWNHIYALIGLPPRAPTRWVALDLSVSDKPPGWQPPKDMIAEIKDFEIP